jgi:hypothetical protein
VVSKTDNDADYHAFLRGLMYRRACFSCDFARSERESDFAIDDNWGIERIYSGFYELRRVSLMLMNTAKGGASFDVPCFDSCERLESTFEIASRENFNLVRPTPIPEGYGGLSGDIDKNLALGDIDRLFGQVLRPPFSLKRALKRSLPPAVFEAARRLKKRLREGNSLDRILLGVAGWQPVARRRPHRVACLSLGSSAPLLPEGSTA